MTDSMPVTFSLFIPDTLFDGLFKESYVFGYYHLAKNNILVNCTTIIKRKKDFEIILRNVLNYNSEGSETLQFLGLMYSSEKQIYIETNILNKYSVDIRFILRINEVYRSFHFEHLLTPYCNFNVQVIIYDGYGIANSQLLPLNKNITDNKSCDKTFVSFLYGTCHDFLNTSNNVCMEEVSSFIKVDFCKMLQLKTNFQLAILWIAAIIYKLTSYVFKWCPEVLIKLILLTALGQQFHQRYFHCSVLCANREQRFPFTLKCKNLICAILVDLLFGCLITYALLNTDIPDMMLNKAILITNDIVNGLQNLINWLMGVPAGLKLNIPLNSALGKFFLYHIYLWESYMMVVQPVFSFIFKMCTVIGIFGLTFVFSLLNDLVSLATIHIYCFYGYAARLYGYQVMSLCALWRLFRGKKWNPLRQRIDSYTYNVHQLYLGTLIFTVLLFLLPTVMVYYFVFTCLRILVLIIQGVMSRLINVLTICPLYCILSRILNSSETTGDVCFTVLNADDVLTLSMKASQVPLMTVIKLTLPEIKTFYEILTWKEFSSSIIWGKIVYPL